MRVLVIIGTRPEAIKMAPIIKQLSREPDVHYRVCVTSQHRELLQQVLDTFDIVPDYDLDVMTENQTPSQVVATIIERLSPVLRRDRPDWVLVQGDTATVMAAALAAFYAKIRVGHVEAGLRTGDKWQPFPEEVHRRITAVVADLHFAPTPRAKHNLIKEGIPSHVVLVTGNTVIDALHWIISHPPPRRVIQLLEKMKVIPHGRRLILVTAHRRENFGAGIRSICTALSQIAREFPDVAILYPVHPNPHVKGPVYELLGSIGNVFLVPPMPYDELAHLMRHAYFIVTDSGGIQEEAPGLGKPVLVLRSVTERPEGVQAGIVRLVGTESQRIVREVSKLLTDEQAYEQMARAVNPYGDGKAAERIVDALLGRPYVEFLPTERINEGGETNG